MSETRRRWFRYSLRTLFVVVGVCAVGLWWVIPSAALRIATSPEVNCERRVIAAKTLGPIERARLRRRLLLRIDSDDVIACDNIEILGEIGDQEALVRLEHTQTFNGEINYVRHAAMEQIRKRLQGADPESTVTVGTSESSDDHDPFP